MCAHFALPRSGRSTPTRLGDDDPRHQDAEHDGEPTQGEGPRTLRFGEGTDREADQGKKEKISRSTPLTPITFSPVLSLLMSKTFPLSG